MILVALRMLAGDRTKYFGLVFGVAFACFLITTLLAMFWGMLARTGAIIDDTAAADIWVTDPAVEYVEEVVPLPDTAVQRVRGVGGVRWAVPLYVGSHRARLEDGRFRSVQVIGVDDATLIGLPRGLGDDTGAAALRRADAVLIDRATGGQLLAGQVDRTAGGIVSEGLRINDRRAVVAGICDVSPRFMPKPTVYTTYSRAVAFAPTERRMLSFVLVRAAAGHDRNEVAAAIERATGYRARTAEAFRADTIRYYIRNTDMIAHVGLMVVLGVTVGFAIVALLLTMFTRENARYYAALKAMGAGTPVLVRMLLAQTLACGAIGFGIGTGGAFLLGTAGDRFGIPFAATWAIPLMTAGCVMLMCAGSIAINLRPVIRLEPGLVFRS